MTNYTPDEVELRDCYAQHMLEYAGEDYATAQDDAERGIAQIKADAWDEAIREAQGQGTIQIPDNPYRQGAGR